MAGQTAFDNVMGDWPTSIRTPTAFRRAIFFQTQNSASRSSLYTIGESDRVNYRNGQPVKPLLKPARQWVFPS